MIKRAVIAVVALWEALWVCSALMIAQIWNVDYNHPLRLSDLDNPHETLFETIQPDLLMLALPLLLIPVVLWVLRGKR